MKFIKVFLLCMFLCCYSYLALAADVWEFWPGNTLKVKLNDKVSLKFLQEFRMHNDMSTFYTYVLYAGPYFKINKYIDTAIWYKFVESKEDDHWEDSHRCDIDGILKYDWGGFKLSNRSRFEHNFTKDSWLYRDRIKITRELETFNRKYAPYISNEFFLDISPDGGYHENRASIGVSTDFFLDTKLTLYYMSRAKKEHGSWENANILGAFIDLAF